MSARIDSAYRAARCAAGGSIAAGIHRSVTAKLIERGNVFKERGYHGAHTLIMKRALPYLACVAGIVVLALVIPRFNDAQPQGIRLTRSDAIPIADAQARQLGIPVDRAWTVLSWSDSALLNKELEPKPELRRRAANDPVIGPRLGGYKRIYYRRGLEKNSPYGYVVVDH